MLLWKTVQLKDYQRALVYERDQLKMVLNPGRYQLMNAWKLRLEYFDVRDIFFEDENAKYLLSQNQAQLKDDLEAYQLSDRQMGLFFKNGVLQEVWQPGSFRVVWRGVDDIRVDIFDVSEADFNGNNARFLMERYPEILSPVLESYQIGEREVGLLYRQGQLAQLLPPGSFRVFWRGVEAVKISVVDISEAFDIDKALLSLLGRNTNVGLLKGTSLAVLPAEVPDQHVGFLYDGGKLVRELDAGNYGFWRFNRSLSVRQMDLRLQSMDVSGQEILTKDRVSLRINLSANFRYLNPRLVAEKLADSTGFVYLELQLRLREAVGTRTLDALLADKDSLNQAVFNEGRSVLEGVGIELASVGVKDIILPGEMKLILNQVVEAQKQAEANLIRRREETQAMRSLHNTAKMMENNATLLRLKELEALEKISDRIDSISVYGGLDSVMNGLVSLK